MSITKKQKDIIARAERAFSEKETRIKQKLEDVWWWVMPERQNPELLGHNTKSISEHIYDSTATRSAQSLANSLMSGMTPPWAQWMQLVPGAAVVDPAEKKKLRELLYLINNIMFQEINKSNFTQEVQPTYLDVVVSTGSITIEPHPSGDGITFKNIPLNEIAVDSGPTGLADYIYRKHELPARELLDRFGPDSKDNRFAKYPEMVEAFKLEPDARHCVWSIVMPDNDKLGGKFRNILVLEKQKTEFVLRDIELNYNPYNTPRWNKPSDSEYGVGPAMESYYDVRYLNRIKELALDNAAMSAGGVFTAKDDGVVNAHTLQIQPNTIIPVMSNDTQNPALQRVDVAGNLDITQFHIDRLRDDIKKAFYADRFGPLEGTPMTATEVLQRAKIIAQELGATYGRFQTELLIPLAEKILAILVEQKKIPPLKIDGQVVDVVFISSLAQAQRLEEVDNLIQWATIAQQLGQMDPEASQLPNYSQIVTTIADRLQVDPSLIRSDEEVRQRLEQAQAGTQQVIGGENGGEAAGAVAGLFG